MQLQLGLRTDTQIKNIFYPDYKGVRETVYQAQRDKRQRVLLTFEMCSHFEVAVSKVLKLRGIQFLKRITLMLNPSSAQKSWRLHVQKIKVRQQSRHCTLHTRVAHAAHRSTRYNKVSRIHRHCKEDIASTPAQYQLKLFVKALCTRWFQFLAN